MKAQKGARRKPRVSSSVPSGFLLVTPHFMLERPFRLHETAAPPHPVPHRRGRDRFAAGPDGFPSLIFAMFYNGFCTCQDKLVAPIYKS